jgi:hypothetical protein
VKRICYNCKKNYNDEKPICPHCFVVHRELFSQEELYNFLEIYLPTKSIRKKQTFVTTKKKIAKMNYLKWLLIGIFTFGLGYLYYLLLSLKALDDHWFYPHGSNENTTQVDMFTSTLLLFFGNIFGFPILQYIRYEKLRRHMKKAPKVSIAKEFDTQGVLMFWLAIIYYILLAGTIAMLVLGIGSIVSGLYFNFNSTFLEVIFFSGAALVFTSSIIVIQRIVKYDKLWQEVFNFHVEWHQK